jgi:hypothetical protein
MADAQTQANLAATEPLFRPSKRRKFYRRRNDEESPNHHGEIVEQLTQTEESGELGGHLPSTKDGVEGIEQPIGEILRLRKLGRARKGGIAFTEPIDHPRSTSGAPTEETSGALVIKDDTHDEITAVTGRFAPQTGQVVDVDKHM